MQLNKHKTKQNAHKVLSSYRHLAIMADAEYAPKMTQELTFDIKGTGGKVASAVENAVIQKVSSQQELEKIAQAINKLKTESRLLLYDRYLCRDEITDVQIYRNMHVSERTFYRKLAVAQLEFAMAYDNGRLLAERRQEQGSENG